MSVRRDISDTSLQAQSPTHLLLKPYVCKGQSIKQIVGLKIEELKQLVYKEYFEL